jgi:hypothetical protein
VFAANADDPDAKRAPSRVADLITPDRMQFQPPVPAKSYLDGFGNVCHVIHAPAGRITISSDFLVRDSGAPDDIAPNAKQHALDKLPVETLVYLLGSRYCETDQFMNVAWAKFGNMAKGCPSFKQSAIMFTTTSNLATSTQVRPKRLGGRIPKGVAYAATSPILRLRYADA